MQRVLTIALTFMLLVVASPLLHQLGLSFYAPDFGLIAVLYVAAATPLTSGMLVVFIIGLLKDAFALGSPIGLYTHIAVVVFLLARGLSGRMNIRSLVTAILVTFFASIVSSVLFLGLSAVFDRTFDSFDVILRMMLPQAMVTAPFAPILFALFDKADRVVSRKGSRTTLFR